VRFIVYFRRMQAESEALERDIISGCRRGVGVGLQAYKMPRLIRPITATLLLRLSWTFQRRGMGLHTDISQ
jgi:hypothetical protein